MAEEDKVVEEIKEPVKIEKPNEDSLTKDPIALLVSACFIFLIGMGVGVLLFNSDGDVVSTTTTTTTTNPIVSTTSPSASSAVNLVVLNDKRCVMCDVSGLIAQLNTLISDLEITTLDYNTGAGKELYEDLSIQYLPAFLFDKTVKEVEAYNSLANYMDPKGTYLSLKIGANFDPTAEICNNNIDDTGNGLVDCDDPDCEKHMACMPKLEKPVVELFVMSHCPYGTQAEKGILPVAQLLGDGIDLSVKFCDYAMHGKTELDEQLLQHCIQEEQDSKYLSYLECFLGDGESDKCLTEVDVDTDALDSCINEMDEKHSITKMYEDKSTWKSGRFPLFPIHQNEVVEYGIAGSPGLAVNGLKIESFGRSPAALLDIICLGFDEMPEECNQSLDSANPAPGFGYEGSGAGTGSCG
ncbi:MAG: hypothetical protein U9M95_01395 [Candidatus Altiarchaeota archaeon]|nr:hypothetical protein [Candidatus Altiarchaeota archaeon]